MNLIHQPMLNINPSRRCTSASHNTTVLGTLSVQTPTSDNHATTKAYVDTATSANSANITTNTNGISSNTTNITLNTTSISSNSADITSNSNSIGSIQTTNTAQDNVITGNTNSINNNNASITSNTDNIQTNLGLININIDKISDIETGLAQSMAMGALAMPSNGKSNFSIATGNYNGTNAIAYGFFHHDSEQDITYRLLGSQSGSVSSSAASIGWSF